MFFLIVRIYMFFKYLFALKNYTVTKAHLEYISPPKKSAAWNKFWKSEERDWIDKEEWQYADVSDTWETISPLPEEVKKVIMTLEYDYEGNRYECVTSNIDIEWPPSEPKETQFSLPIIQAMMMDDDIPVRDITEELKRKMGPRKDFHGEGEVLVEDLFEWDDYTDVMVTNILNFQKTVSRKSKCLELL